MTQFNYTIKPIETENEWQQMKLLLAELLAFEKSLRPQRKETENVIHGAFRYVRENISTHNGLSLIAIDGHGQPVGFMNGWLENSDGLDKGDNRIGYISDAYIRPEFRNAYLFKKMGNVMAEHFTKTGVSHMGFDTLGSNVRMQQLFISSGFTPHKVYFEIKLPETSV